MDTVPLPEVTLTVARARRGTGRDHESCLLREGIQERGLREVPVLS